MTSLPVIALALIMWGLTLVKFREMRSERKKQKGEGDVTKIATGMLLFSALTMTFKVNDFASFFDAHTFPNLSLLCTHLVFLASQYLFTATTLTTIETPSTKRAIQTIRPILFLLITALCMIYIFFISKMPPYLDDEPQGLPIVIFKFLSYPFGMMLCGLMLTTYLAHLPSEKLPLMRLRAMMLILANLIGGAFIFSRLLIFSAYFWPFLLSEPLLILSNVLLIFAVFLFAGAFLSDRLYAQFVIISKSIEHWHIFQDLKYLVDRLIVLCPTIGLPPEKPGFFRFLLKPDYYLYRTIIIILDSKALLSDFFSDAIEPNAPEILWENKDLRHEAMRIHQTLQAAKPSNDFADIVETYRRVSRELFTQEASP